MSIPDQLETGKIGHIGEGHEADTGIWSRFFGDWVLVAIILLTATLSLGLGIAIGKEHAGGKGKEDRVWIEQLPKDEIQASTSAHTVDANASPIPSMAAAAAAIPSVSNMPSTHPTVGVYVASRTGTKYYLPTCGTAKRIKEENKVWFATKAEAEKAGYEPGANCKGL